jgi:uncharacterized membrane protein
MRTIINRNILFLISLGLFLWLTGIVLAPVLAASEIKPLSYLSSFLYFLYQPVCHQMADRSVLIDYIPMAVCVRCFAAYLGGWLLSIFYLKYKKITMWPTSIYLTLLIPFIFDFLLEKIHLYSNIGLVRFGTGMLLGIVIFQLFFLSTASRQKLPETKSVEI